MVSFTPPSTPARFQSISIRPHNVSIVFKVVLRVGGSFISGCVSAPLEFPCNLFAVCFRLTAAGKRLFFILFLFLTIRSLFVFLIKKKKIKERKATRIRQGRQIKEIIYLTIRSLFVFLIKKKKIKERKATRIRQGRQIKEIIYQRRGMIVYI
jgi:hypothetical protein